MNYKYAYGYVGNGMCPNCSIVAPLFVHSRLVINLDNIRTFIRPSCRRCVVRSISWLYDSLTSHTTTRHEISEETLADIKYEVENPQPMLQFEIECTCSRCGGLPIGEDLISARENESEVLVHSRCSRQCASCNTNFSFGDTLAKVINFQGNPTCLPCRITEISKNGGLDNYDYCSSCSGLLHVVNLTHYGASLNYCVDCYYDYISTCDVCDLMVHRNEFHSCEFENEEDLSGSAIHSYWWKPRAEFFGKDKYYLGFELEIESRNGERIKHADWIQDALGGRIYLKEDSSLGHGFEIVSHPHSLNEYQKSFNWDKIKHLTSLGCRSWDTDTCGIHVHVSRTAFWSNFIRPSTQEERNNWILKNQAHELRFMKLIYDNEYQVTRLAGRKSEDYASFSDKDNLVRKVENCEWGSRAQAVNTKNENTIEVRIFKGSLRPTRILSAIEFVHASVEYTRNLEVSMKSKPFSWLRFTSYISENDEMYPNLALVLEETFQREKPIATDREE